MRIIDADRLKYVISCALDVYKQEDDASSAAAMGAMIRTFLEFVDEAPAVDIAVLFAKAYQKGREDALKESTCSGGEKCDGHNNHGDQPEIRV